MINKVSIIIRTYNGEKYLEKVLMSVFSQKLNNIEFNVILVDSGSTDSTLDIAKKYNVIIVHIAKEDFSYGYALNVGFEEIKTVSQIGISLSDHCIPVGKFWLKNLITPILDNKTVLTFGSHTGGNNVRTSEYNFYKYKFINLKKGFVHHNYFNNGNSAFLIDIWEKNKFDETLNAQEDIDFARRVTESGFKVFYVPRASVKHIHNFTNIQLFNRLYLELAEEMNLGVKSTKDIFNYILNAISSIKIDIKKAYKKKKLSRSLPGIIKFRIIQISAAISVSLSSFFKANNE